MSLQEIEKVFGHLNSLLMDQLRGGEHLILQLSGEETQFIRFNRARVRQTGTVSDANLTLKFIYNERTAYATFPLRGDTEVDTANALENLDYLRKEVQQLPPDPYITLPQNQGSSHEVYEGKLLNPEKAVEFLLPPVEGLDFTGLYAGGKVIRANANSAGQKHWFSTDSYFLDYSLIAPSEKAVKSIFAGSFWEQSEYEKQIRESVDRLARLDRDIYQIEPGKYRTYFAPAATADLIGMLSWGAISESSLRQGGSALNKMRTGEKLSSLFSLKENFAGGNVPRFNDLGEMSALELPLIVGGELVNTLVSSRSAKEYGLQSNGASSGEGLRAPEVDGGTLTRETILKTLDTGLYLSNLHYLNWSDQTGGRITGMTRYACFWVENGEIVAPIKDMRFDESLYSFLGDNLKSMTDFREFIPETGTYEQRSLGGSLMPGMLVEDFSFTL
ncbi:MAG: hypothetical protein N5P05_001198 [Chroococcopsis gigantea SAG 12.99]|jgi:predicted Zn-dependent protease|nr:TldD/PmbA family protein [Chlorogloea purpurea SAG 13.99]MDV2999592.1 hypothetical protein [Chroococcopsis gigantea SAG 12.99]